MSAPAGPDDASGKTSPEVPTLPPGHPPDADPPTPPPPPRDAPRVNPFGVIDTPPLPGKKPAEPTGPWPTIQGYEVLGVLGRGGMGVVYKARQLRLNRLVALKMILSAEHAHPEHIARFHAEAEAVARLHHPHIVQIYEVGEQDGRPFFSLEYIEGTSLARRLNGTPLPARQAAQLVETLARTMAYAHQRGVIHRDLKPGNILLEAKDGRASGEGPDAAFGLVPKVTDFGLAKQVDLESGQTQSGAILGTPSYMAPEQAAGKGRQVGPAADVYALGAILYELLTGRPPFRGETPLDTVREVLTAEPVPPSRLHARLPRDIETICMKCLEKEPRQRYPSADELADDLGRFRANQPIKARPVGRWQRAAKWAQRRPAVAGLLAALAVVVAGGFAGMTALWLRAEAQRQAAQDAEADALAQRDRARAAVDQFHTEVSESPELKAQGLEKLRTRLLETALPFYEQFVREQGDAPGGLDVRVARGQAYWRLANLYRATGRNDQAEAAYRQALAIQQDLADADPAEPQYRHDLARTSFDLGNLYHALGRDDDARTPYGRAHDLFGQLVRDHPESAEWRKDLGTAQNALANLDLLAGHMGPAESAYGAARAQFQRLVDEHPQVPAYQTLLAGTLHNLATVYHNTGRTGDALKAYQAALEVQTRVVDANPDDADGQKHLAGILNNLGYLYHDLGRDSEAEAAMEAARDVYRRVAERHPAVPEYQMLLAMAHANLGAMYREVDRNTAAEQSYQAALAIQQRLADAHPGVPDYEQDLARTQFNLGNLYRDTDRPAPAELAYQAALAIQRQLVTRLPKVPDHQQALARTCDGLAVLDLHTGRTDSARAAGEEALSLLQRLTEAHPDVIEYAIDLGFASCHRADLLRETGDPVAALSWYGRAQDRLGKVLAKEPKHEEAQKALAQTHEGKARTLTRLGRHRDALDEWDRAIAVDHGRSRAALRSGRAATLARLGERGRAVAEADELAREKSLPGEALYQLAVVYALASSAAVSDGPTSRPGREELGERYAAQAVQLLQRAEREGLFNTPAAVERLKDDRDLKPLRGRAEFGKLLGAIESKGLSTKWP
jgi:tetratricopeptide (TPR) repeat protein/tRNA A-37 threonylcarbamoyl transferase component Bud32